MMKKLILSTGIFLFAFLAYSQESDGPGSTAGLSVISRLDLDPAYSGADNTLGFSHGNSCIYTLFEGSASEHFSWTLANHWISSGGDYGWPYNNLGRSDVTNWVDFCRADLTFGSWKFSLGKDLMSTGGFEYENWDWDIYKAMASPLWSGLACYQWGGKAAYTTDSGMSTFSLQMTTSPSGAYPFQSGLWAYSAQWRGEYGWFSNIWSASAIQKAGGFDYLISLGQKASFDKWSVILDLNNNDGFADDCSVIRGFTSQVTLKYTTSEKFNIALRGEYVTSDIADASRFCYIGTVAEYSPLKASDDLRLHAFLAYPSGTSLMTFSVGARYNLRIKIR